MPGASAGSIELSLKDIVRSFLSGDKYQKSLFLIFVVNDLKKPNNLPDQTARKTLGFKPQTW